MPLTVLLNWSSGGHPAVEMADCSPDSPHLKPVGFKLSKKAEYDMASIVRLIFML